jgi:aspartate aminotransferase-like enzyme
MTKDTKNPVAGVEALDQESVQSLDARIEWLEHLTEGRYGKRTADEQARYGAELEAARAEWERRFPPEGDESQGPTKAAVAKVFSELEENEAKGLELDAAEGEGRR